MDDRTRQNWEKVKLALEATGKTDSFFYRRAVIVLKTGATQKSTQHQIRCN